MHVFYTIIQHYMLNNCAPLKKNKVCRLPALLQIENIYEVNTSINHLGHLRPDQAVSGLMP